MIRLEHLEHLACNASGDIIDAALRSAGLPIGRHLGNGSFAHVWENTENPDTVFKFTRDETHYIYLTTPVIAGVDNSARPLLVKDYGSVCDGGWLVELELLIPLAFSPAAAEREEKQHNTPVTYPGAMLWNFTEVYEDAMRKFCRRVLNAEWGLDAGLDMHSANVMHRKYSGELVLSDPIYNTDY